MTEIDNLSFLKFVAAIPLLNSVTPPDCRSRFLLKLLFAVHRSTINNLSIENLCLAQPSFPSVNFCHSSLFRFSCPYQTNIEFSFLDLGNATLLLSILVDPLIRHLSVCGVFPSLLLFLASLFAKLYSWNILALTLQFCTGDDYITNPLMCIKHFGNRVVTFSRKRFWLNNHELFPDFARHRFLLWC